MVPAYGQTRSTEQRKYVVVIARDDLWYAWLSAGDAVERRALLEVLDKSVYVTEVSPQHMLLLFL